ncbi:hypothetical protein HY627_00660 [Candidatus Uhrbacteria bacterium]|nr:hypothetical protein [Candidatus Uhrbacteria bacterium]
MHAWKALSAEQKIEWILRVGVFGEFLGHGLLALGGKKDWISWISQLTGLDASVATTLLLVVGIADVVTAFVILVKPVKPLLLWMAFWGFWTALVRPLVGIGWLDFIERFANWAAPLALYYLLPKQERK